jgi:hypothetical protein
VLRHSTTIPIKQLSRHSPVTVEKEVDIRTEQNQIKFIINNILKGVLYSIQYDYGTDSIFKSKDDHIGEDGVYIGK